MIYFGRQSRMNAALQSDEARPPLREINPNLITP
jgi:hypothetical protein